MLDGTLTQILNEVIRLTDACKRAASELEEKDRQIQQLSEALSHALRDITELDSKYDGDSSDSN